MNKEFKELKKKLAEKYHDQIALISTVRDVDMGVALDMLIAYETVGGESPYINHNEFVEDYIKLLEVAKKC